MARVSTCLNFPRNTEAAFEFYRSVFGGAFDGPVQRFADVPPAPGQPLMADADKALVMLVALQDMFGGAYFGNLADRFGTRWMVNCANKA